MVDFTVRGRRIAAALAAAAIAVAAGGCGSSDDSSPSSTITAAAPTAAGSADTDAVAHAFVTFFSGDSSGAEKVTLVQNGPAFADTINAQADSPLAKGTTATVANVDLDAPGHATVTYTVLMNGQPVLADQMGEAVQVNGTWQVAQSTFCALLTLEGNPPPVCAASPTSAPPPTS